MDAPQVERKLAAIFAADVEGYSRLMGIDEVGTLRTLTAYRSIMDGWIARHRGRIANTAGDSVLAEFTSVTDAMECALEVQRAMAKENAKAPDDQRMWFRIGIHVGDVLARGGEIFGDAVNIAARLQALAETGGVCVSGVVADHVRNKFPLALTDFGEHGLKNIGELVHVWRVRTDASAPATVGLPARASSPGLSVVVLPFTNLGGDPEQEYLVDGITDDLTTDLSRIPNSFVIARNSAFTYKGKAVDVKVVGRELGVRYVLEGSVRRFGDQVRVNTQLIDADTRSHLWAERFDCDRSNLMRMQDEITGRIAQALDLEFIELESRRSLREHPLNPDAADLTMQGWSVFNRPRSRDNNAAARALFEGAVRLDERAANAWAGIAITHATDIGGRWSSNRPEKVAAGEEAAMRALAFDPRHSKALFARGVLLNCRGRFEEALLAFEASLASNRNYVLPQLMIGNTKMYLGRPEEVFEPVQHAILLSPRDPQSNQFYFTIGRAHFMLGRYDDAVMAFRTGIAAGPCWYWSYLWLAAAYAVQGDDKNARRALADFHAVVPTYTVGQFRAEGFQSSNPAYLALMERFEEGLRRAGQPE